MLSRCAPPPLVPGQQSRCAALGLDSRWSRRHSTGVPHGEELIHGTQHQQVKVEDHVGIEVPPGAPRCGPQPCRPVPSGAGGPRAGRPAHMSGVTAIGPAATAPPRCHPLRALRWGFGLYGRTSPRHSRRAHSGPGCHFGERAPRISASTLPPLSKSWHDPIGVCRTLTRVCSLVHGETCPACRAPTTVK